MKSMGLTIIFVQRVDVLSAWTHVNYTYLPSRTVKTWKVSYMNPESLITIRRLTRACSSLHLMVIYPLDLFNVHSMSMHTLWPADPLERQPVSSNDRHVSLNVPFRLLLLCPMRETISTKLPIKKKHTLEKWNLSITSNVIKNVTRLKTFAETL